MFLLKFCYKICFTYNIFLGCMLNESKEFTFGKKSNHENERWSFEVFEESQDFIIIITTSTFSHALH